MGYKAIYIMLIGFLVFGIIFILIGYAISNLDFLINIGGTIIGSGLVGLFVAIASAKLSESVQEGLEARRSHKEDINRLLSKLLEEEPPVGIFYDDRLTDTLTKGISYTFKVCDRLKSIKEDTSEENMRDSLLWEDLKNHWPQLKDSIEELCNSIKRHNNKVRGLRNYIRKKISDLTVEYLSSDYPIFNEILILEDFIKEFVDKIDIELLNCKDYLIGDRRYLSRCIEYIKNTAVPEIFNYINILLEKHVKNNRIHKQKIEVIYDNEEKSIFHKNMAKKLIEIIENLKGDEHIKSNLKILKEEKTSLEERSREIIRNIIRIIDLKRLEGRSCDYIKGNWI